jgi:hypothetical protein
MTIYLKAIFGTEAFDKLGRVLEITPGLIQFHGSPRDRVCETRKDSTAAAGARGDTDFICGNLWTLAHNSLVAPHYAPNPVNIGAEGLLLRSELNLRFHLLQEFSDSSATRPVSIYECLERFLWTTVHHMCPHSANTPMVVNSFWHRPKLRVPWVTPIKRAKSSSGRSLVTLRSSSSRSAPQIAARQKSCLLFKMLPASLAY